MSDILCRWLNEDVQLSRKIVPDSFAEEFSNGYLIGELLHIYGMQDDFEMFSPSGTSEAKLNNFTRIEPVMALLDIKFDTNMAQDIIDEKDGVITKLMYQLFIALGKKIKLNLTGVAMETMRPSGPMKLGYINSDMYKERLKTLVPRQVDLHFDELVSKYNKKQKEQEEKARKAREEDDEKRRSYQQQIRQQGLEKSRQIRKYQDNVMAKIKEATVKIPKIPPQKKNGKNKLEILKEKEIQSVYKNIDAFEKSLRNVRALSSPQSSQQIRDIDNDIEKFLNDSSKPSIKETTISADASKEYVEKIKERCNADAEARKEREKRRRRVLVEQMKAHELQEEKRREDIYVNRLMKQSLMERRIAVQLMHVRQEKDIIKQNRLERERQFSERRMKDFEDALEREAEMCRQAKIEYAEEIRKNQELHDAIAKERAMKKYDKHYSICKEIAIDLIDFTCKVGEYKELTEQKLPAKLVREWKTLFLAGQPLYKESIITLTEEEEESLRIEESQQTVLDEEDFSEYKEFRGEWQPAEGSILPPTENAVLGYIISRLNEILDPPPTPPEEPKFPAFPIKVCVLGKFYSGKTTIVKELVENHRLEMLNIDSLLQQAIEAWKINETSQVYIDQPICENKGDGNESKKESASNAKETKPINDDTTKDDNIPKDPEIIPATPVVDDLKSTSYSREMDGNQNENDIVVTERVLIEQISERAELGKKIESFLKAGSIIPDTLLVDIMLEHIRNIPDGTGWVMDGFPSTVQQAKLLEKGLTGYDPLPSPVKSTSKDAKRGRKSKLAYDPRPQAEIKAPKSGIDITILFDIEDDIVLKRAEGRTIDPEANELYHEEYNPPPYGAYTGLQNKNKFQTVIDMSNDKEQAQTRLTSFQDNWPKLERWFNKFGILTKIDAKLPKGEVYVQLKEILDDTLQKIADAEKAEKENSITKEEASETKLTQEDKETTPAPKTDTPSETIEASQLKSESKENDVAKSSPQKEERKSKESFSPKKGAKSKDKRTPSPKKSKETTTKSPSRKKSRSESSRIEATLIENITESIEVIQKPPSPIPGTLEWNFVELPVDIEIVGILASYWDMIEASYLTMCKHVFRKIRQENQTIYQYFYNTRKTFFEYLTRPDEKQEFVLEWQKDFNLFPEDMRCDDDSKAELHQRVDDLCDRLWDICDCRKEENEAERQTIMTEKWLEDHIGLLLNHYISLVQSETDRYQQTCNLLKDYYKAMQGKMLGDNPPGYTRLPLVELPPTEPPLKAVSVDNTCNNENEDSLVMSPKPISASKHQMKAADINNNTKTQETVPEEKSNRIPLVSRKGFSGELSQSRLEKRRTGSKKDRSNASSEEKLSSPSPSLLDFDEKLLLDAIGASLLVIEQQLTADALERDQESQTKEKHIELPKVPSKDKKAGGKKGDRKSPNKASKTQIQSPSIPAAKSIELSEEEKQKVDAIEKMKKEYNRAIEIEGDGLNARIEVIKKTALNAIKKLREKGEATFQDMDDWLGKRFKQEMESIQQMTEMVRAAIENENRLQNACILEDKEFYIDDDLHVFRTPTPPRVPSPREVSQYDAFTCIQLDSLVKQFKEVAPFGLMAVKKFYQIMIELPSSTVGQEALPSQWMDLSLKKLENIGNILKVNNEYISWKQFLLQLAHPYPIPDQTHLMEALNEFKKIDEFNSGNVTREEYEKVHTWIDDPSNEIAINEPSSYDRSQHLKKIIFDVFSHETSEGDMLDYKDMLLYFVAEESPLDGLRNALSIILGIDIDESAFLPEPENLIDQLENDRKNENEVSTHHLMWLFNHGIYDQGGYRVRPQDMPRNYYSLKTFEDIYEELGYLPEKNIQLSLLLTHPIIRDMLETCKKYMVKNIQSEFNKKEEQEIAQ